jgi:hypothetical protein
MRRRTSIGGEADQSGIGGSDPYRAIRRLCQRIHVERDIRIGMPLGQRARSRIESPQTVERAQQQAAVAQHQHAAHRAQRRLFSGLGVVHDRAVGLQPLQASAGRRHPQATAAITCKRGHAVGSQRAGTSGFRQVAGEPVELGIVAVQAAGLGRDPQPGVIGDQRGDVVVRQRPRCIAIVPVGLERVAVETRQAILRADPEKAGRVLRYRARGRLRDPLRRAVRAEAHALDTGNVAGMGAGANSQQRASRGRNDPARHAPHPLPSPAPHPSRLAGQTRADKRHRELPRRSSCAHNRPICRRRHGAV